MSMCLEVTTLGRQHIEAIIDYPPLVWRVLAPDEPNYFWYEVEQFTQLMNFPKRYRLIDGSATPPEFHYGEGEGVNEYFDKSWHGIHYLLTNTVWEGSPPLNFIVMGGTPIPETDTSYGPIRIFDVLQTRSIAQALIQLDQLNVAEHFDCQEWMRMAIYPVDWESRGRNKSLAYLQQHLTKLRSFIINAANNKVGFLMFIS